MRWGVAGRMVIAWLTTLPSAAIVGAVCWFLADLIGGGRGVAVDFVILVGASLLLYRRSLSTTINHDNVNDAWQDGLVTTSKDEPPVKIAA